MIKYIILLSLLLNTSCFGQITLFNAAETKATNEANLQQNIKQFKQDVETKGQANQDALKTKAKKDVPEPPEGYGAKKQKPRPVPVPVEPPSPTDTTIPVSSQTVQQPEVTNFPQNKSIPVPPSSGSQNSLGIKY